MNKQEAMKQAAIEFAKGSPIKEVMDKYNVSYASVYNAIKRHNIPYKKTYGRTIFFNENYFNNIISEEQAYWLGFIMADGNISKTDVTVSSHNRLTISVSETDKEHLDKFKQLIKHTGEYYIKSQKKSYSLTPMYYLNCNSILLVSDLMQLGCLPNKTGNSAIPNIPSRLMNHFIRGYFDGDGCMSVYIDKQTGKLRGEFSITTDKNILKEIQLILMKECDLKQTGLKSYKRTELAYSLRYGGKNQLQRIFNYLYKDASVYLQRKHDKFTLLLS